jgi:hypothetical protein
VWGLPRLHPGGRGAQLSEIALPSLCFSSRLYTAYADSESVSLNPQMNYLRFAVDVLCRWWSATPVSATPSVPHFEALCAHCNAVQNAAHISHGMCLGCRHAKQERAQATAAAQQPTGVWAHAFTPDVRGYDAAVLSDPAFRRLVSAAQRARLGASSHLLRRFVVRSLK